MGYWTYYLLFIVAWLVIGHPWLLLGILLVFLFRRFIPDPWILLRTFGQVRRLRAQIDTNPSNATARRDLARIYLSRMRPRAALQLLDEARQRDPDNPELLYLTGLARYRSGREEDALEPLVRAIDLDGRVSFGEPYLIAGDALTALSRHEEAIDAYERYVDHNTSSIQGWTKLAMAHRRHGEREEAKKALSEAHTTWGQIPNYRRRKELTWFLRAQLYRLVI